MTRDWEPEADRLGSAAVAAGDPTAWYEQLWSAADRGEVTVPWDRDLPGDQVAARIGAGSGRAVVIGAGLGADAEHVAAQGWATTAFDISASAVKLVRERRAGSPVDYRVADLLDLPADLVEAFDLVVEVYTVQALHPSLRPRAVQGVRRLLAEGGTALVVQMVRGDRPADHGPPWLLDRDEMLTFAADDVQLVSLDVVDPSRPGAPARWVGTFRRLAR